MRVIFLSLLVLLLAVTALAVTTEGSDQNQANTNRINNLRESIHRTGDRVKEGIENMVNKGKEALNLNVHHTTEAIRTEAIPAHTHTDVNMNTEAVPPHDHTNTNVLSQGVPPHHHTNAMHKQGSNAMGMNDAMDSNTMKNNPNTMSEQGIPDARMNAIPNLNAQPLQQQGAQENMHTMNAGEINREHAKQANVNQGNQNTQGSMQNQQPLHDHSKLYGL